MHFFRRDSPTVAIDEQHPLPARKPQTSKRKPSQRCAQGPDRRTQRVTSCTQLPKLRPRSPRPCSDKRCSPACDAGLLAREGSGVARYGLHLASDVDDLCNPMLRTLRFRFFCCAQGCRDGAQRSQVCTQRINRCTQAKTAARFTPGATPVIRSIGRAHIGQAWALETYSSWLARIHQHGRHPRATPSHAPAQVASNYGGPEFHQALTITAAFGNVGD